MTEENQTPYIADDDDDTEGHIRRGTDDDDDTEGHIRRGTDDDDDTEGHIRRGTDDDDDTEGHIRRGTDDDDDTEGHIRRGTDDDDDTEGHIRRGTDDDDDTEGHIRRLTRATYCSVGASASRSRAHKVTRSSWAICGFSLSSEWKSQDVMANVRKPSLPARTVAVRGFPSSREISPK